ncbi:hypothetical protein [Mycolicibacterium sp. XJ775]|jgi:hypothetical protein
MHHWTSMSGCRFRSIGWQQFPGYTANRAVNAVPFVCAAEPGIRSTLDLPQIVATMTD